MQNKWAHKHKAIIVTGVTGVGDNIIDNLIPNPTMTEEMRIYCVN